MRRIRPVSSSVNLRERAERHDELVVEAEKSQELALLFENADHLNVVVFQAEQLADRASVGEQSCGDVVPNHAHRVARRRLLRREEAPRREVARGRERVVVVGAEREDLQNLAVAVAGIGLNG
jgi:hypothetical protein